MKSMRAFSPSLGSPCRHCSRPLKNPSPLLLPLLPLLLRKLVPTVRSGHFKFLPLRIAALPKTTLPLVPITPPSAVSEDRELELMVERKLVLWLVHQAQIAPAISRKVASALIENGVASIERLEKRLVKNSRFLLEVRCHLTPSIRHIRFLPFAARRRGGR